MHRRAVPQGPHGQRGFALILVTMALVLLAATAARFASRVDALRDQAAATRTYADGHRTAADARAIVWYWLATRPVGLSAAGFSDEVPLRLDGRWYRFGSGAWVAIQDQRGLLSANVVDRVALRSLLAALGIDAQRAEAYIDVLEDYVDADSLRRVNGAEASDYAALGLPPPRNSWLLALPEVCRLPLWRDEPAICATVLRLLTTRRDGLFNPNTAPTAVLNAKLPLRDDVRVRLFETLRETTGFANGADATAMTGLPMDRDDFLFHASNAVRVTVWAPGLPASLEYNITLIPTLATGPWLLQELSLASRPEPSDQTTRARPFPVPSPDLPRAAAPSASPP